MKMLRDPLFWLIALFVALIFWLPYSQPLFAALVPQLPRPVYQQESFAALALAHFWLVGISSLFAVIIGTCAGIAVTRAWGAEFRPLVETIAAVGQTFPPVAVLAIAVPVIGFGLQPAIIALILYGVLPVLQALALAHFWLVGISSLFAVIIGTGAGIAVTRPWGAEFRPLGETIAAVGQTFPPVAVLAIAVPVIGFGLKPAIIALILYGVLAVLQATLAGLGALDASVTEVAKGMGMSRGQRLRKVELPLAAPVILAGVRTSVIINIGTAGGSGDSGWRANFGAYQHWYGYERLNGRGQHAWYAHHHRT